jgi:hypothetical protein
MFEFTSETDTNAQSEATAHIQEVFTTLRHLKKQEAELTQAERERRKGFYRKEIRIHPCQIKGHAENKQNYEDTLKTFKSMPGGSHVVYLAALNEKKQELTSRLTELSILRDNLHAELKVVKESLLPLQGVSEDYAQKLADGDIYAAETLESHRKTQLQEKNIQQQELLSKIEGISFAENIINKELATYWEIEKTINSGLELQRYNDLKAQFDNVFSQLEEISNEINPIARKLWAEDYERWEHLNMIQLLINKVKNNALHYERLNKFGSGLTVLQNNQFPGYDFEHLK